MRIRRVVGAVLVAALGGGVTTALAQVPSGASVMPPGFTVVSDRMMGPARIAEVSKPNVGWPKGFAAQEIRITYMWQPNPAAARLTAMMGQQPEEPSRQSMGMTRSEPAGKASHRDGVLTWRRSVTPYLGSGSAPDLVLIEGTWVGAVADGLLTIGVTHYCGTKEAALALIDGILDKASARKIP